MSFIWRSLRMWRKLQGRYIKSCFFAVGQRTDAIVVQKSNIGQFTRDGNCPVRICEAGDIV